MSFHWQLVSEVQVLAIFWVPDGQEHTGRWPTTCDQTLQHSRDYGVWGMLTHLANSTLHWTGTRVQSLTWVWTRFLNTTFIKLRLNVKSSFYLNTSECQATIGVSLTSFLTSRKVDWGVNCHVSIIDTSLILILTLGRAVQQQQQQWGPLCEHCEDHYQIFWSWSIFWHIFCVRSIIHRWNSLWHHILCSKSFITITSQMELIYAALSSVLSASNPIIYNLQILKCLECKSILSKCTEFIFCNNV